MAKLTEPVITCPHCGKTQPSREALDQHVKEEHGSG